MLAAAEGYDTTIQILIDKGADVSAQDLKGQTALMLAASEVYDTTIQILIDKGADVNAQDSEGQTALMPVPATGHKKTVQILINSILNSTNRTIQAADSRATIPD